jgi:hypothetical protein
METTDDGRWQGNRRIATCPAQCPPPFGIRGSAARGWWWWLGWLAFLLLGEIGFHFHFTSTVYLHSTTVSLCPCLVHSNLSLCQLLFLPMINYHDNRQKLPDVSLSLFTPSVFTNNKLWMYVL